MTSFDSGCRSACLPRRLFVLALSLLATALLFDLVDLSTGTGALAPPAYWLAAAGVVAGVAAGLCRLWRPGPGGARGSPWRFATLPGFFKAVAIALCAGGWSLRTVEGDAPAAGLALALAGVSFALASRFLPSAQEGDGEASAAAADGRRADNPADAPHGVARERAARGL